MFVQVLHWLANILEGTNSIQTIVSIDLIIFLNTNWNLCGLVLKVLSCLTGQVVTFAWQAMRLFLVWDSEGVSEKADVVVEQLFEAIDADDSGSESSGDKKRRKQKTQKKRKRSSSSGSVKTISSSSESSDEVRRYLQCKIDSCY